MGVVKSDVIVDIQHQQRIWPRREQRTTSNMLETLCTF